MCKTFPPVYNSAKIIKIDQYYPELWSQMYCHLFMVHSIRNVTVVWFHNYLHRHKHVHHCNLQLASYVLLLEICHCTWQYTQSLVPKVDGWPCWVQQLPRGVCRIDTCTSELWLRWLACHSSSLFSRWIICATVHDDVEVLMIVFFTQTYIFITYT